jgi:hypothetical protein
MAGGLLRDLDLLLVVLPLEDLVGFFLLLGTSLAPDTFSDLFRLFEALVTLSNVDIIFILLYKIFSQPDNTPFHKAYKSEANLPGLITLRMTLLLQVAMAH